MSPRSCSMPRSRVDSAFVVDSLHLQDRVGRGGFERPIAIVAGPGGQDRPPERLAPEPGRARDVIGAAVDEERAELALVHAVYVSKAGGCVNDRSVDRIPS